MDQTDLYNLIEPCVSAMVKDAIWPVRCGERPAEDALTVTLLTWAIKHFAGICFDDQKMKTFDRSEVGTLRHWSGEPLVALVAAYKHEKRIA
jgi:hypothetical protein